jgi:hypothetical protein
VHINSNGTLPKLAVPYYGIPTILAHGGKPRSLEALAAGTQKGTAFLA